ncbi:E3 ubiquitin-protein ligase RNF133-like isoform X2 [Eriocheir sinensis]|uniref:E3 ubiquitin-protein ligase RNF133-like isoform X2 n=1 Tax=Eriocheir sinensis TaxID=95602 RepID=UPI0021C9CD08|nr:E3 ubiquitin-protein ligase RNF133-like isoform X2 [Eriocheir sinensis]
MNSFAFGLAALTSTTLITLTTATWTYEGTTVTLALVNYTYRDPRRDGVLVEVGQVGKYAPGQVASASGRVIASQSKMAGSSNGDLEGPCHFPWSPPSPAPIGPWVALVGRGRCPDKDKVAIAASSNASAVILYSNDPHIHLRKISMSEPGLPVVWLGEEEGRGLAGVVGGGAEVVITLTPGHHLKYHVTSVNRQTLGNRFVSANPVCEPRMFPVDCFIVTSVLFVSVSFIILMAISLAWLVFYYVQRFRYIHAKDRLARHLCNAAKKALAKIPVKNLKATDKEVTLEGECCAVCIEHYQAGEAVRTLPCKHQFHRFCVDPWLLEHRTCPMCKMDILKHYGYVLSESEESVMQLDLGDGGEGGRGGQDTPLPRDSHTPRSARTTSHITPVVMVSRSESLREGRGGRGGGGSNSMGYGGGGSAGGMWHDGGLMIGMPVPDIPIHSPTAPSSLFSLLSPSKSVSPSLSTSSSSSTLEKFTPLISARSPPPSPHHPQMHTGADHPHTTTDAEAEADLELSSVSSRETSLSSTATAALPPPPHSPAVGGPSATLECVQVVPVPVRQTQAQEEKKQEEDTRKTTKEEEEEAEEEEATATTSSNPSSSSSHPTPPKRSRSRKRSAPEGSSPPVTLPSSASHVVSVSHF